MFELNIKFLFFDLNLVQESINLSGTITCAEDNDCKTFSSLMKCQNQTCRCQMGFHLDGHLCGSLFFYSCLLYVKNLFEISSILVKGLLTLNSSCAIQMECGVNTICDQNNVCSCLTGLSSINDFDCCRSSFYLITKHADFYLGNFHFRHFCSHSNRNIHSSNLPRRAQTTG